MGQWEGQLEEEEGGTIEGGASERREGGREASGPDVNIGKQDVCQGEHSEEDLGQQGEVLRPVEEGSPGEAQNDSKQGDEQHGEVQGILLPSPSLGTLLGTANVDMQHRVAAQSPVPKRLACVVKDMSLSYEDDTSVLG